MTAALKYQLSDSASVSALLGVERSARGYRWVERLEPGRAHLASSIAQVHALPELLGRVLAARGAEIGTVSRYLDPSLRTLLPDPARLQDMERAATRFAAAITAEERNRRVRRLRRRRRRLGRPDRALSARPRPAAGDLHPGPADRRLWSRPPRRLRSLVQDGARLILTVDCGTTASPAIDAANAAGAEVIVIDHHQADEALPRAYAVLNPNRQDDLSGQGHLAAAGVVFLFLVAATRVLRREGYYRGRAEPDLLGLLDLVALATVCDVVPLKDANRAFVAKGLKVLRLRNNAGLRALADTARIDAAPTPYTLGFILGPRINAGGRVGSSHLGAKLLACDDDIEARAISAKLEALNAERKAIEERMLEDAFARAEAALAATPDAALLFLGAEGWHKGLLGLIAGRIAERYHRPTFIAAHEPDGTATGSARSIASVDLGAAVREAVHEGLLIKGGGHAMAAGFKLERRKQEALHDFLHRAPRGAGRLGRHAPAAFHRRRAVGPRRDHGADGPARPRRSVRSRPCRAALRLSGASPVARAEPQGRACPLHAGRPPTAAASRPAPSASPAPSSGSCC